MRAASKRTLKIIAISCCCFVLFAATAHLLHHHPIPSHPKHGKATFNVACSLCMFSVKTAFQPVFVPPPPGTLVICFSCNKRNNFKSYELSLLPVVRAPPHMV